MSATHGGLDAVMDELKAVRRFTAAALVAAAVATIVALVAITKPTLMLPNASTEPMPPPASTQPAPPSPQHGASVVEAERVVIRDKAGHERAELGVDPNDNHAELTLLASDGTRRVVLATVDTPSTGAHLTFYHGNAIDVSIATATRGWETSSSVLVFDRQQLFKFPTAAAP
jgi:hypothetical protein